MGRGELILVRQKVRLEQHLICNFRQQILTHKIHGVEDVVSAIVLFGETDSARGF
jgi:hypothetical protein